MARHVPIDELKRIEEVVRARPGSTSTEIAEVIGAHLAQRTLQFWLKRLVDDGRVIRDGERRWARYRMSDAPISVPRKAASDEATIPLSPESHEIRAYLRQPLAARTPVGYHPEFLNAYRPGETFYLPEEARVRLAGIRAKSVAAPEPAGAHARHVIDLSWNSSRLEGNSYSLLETTRLIEFGQEAPGRNRLDAQMILNHKDAVEFLIGHEADIGFNRYTILNLHAILANNLRSDERAAGRLRRIGVRIDGSVYHPLERPQFVEQCFDQLLATAAAITDPFEQAFFVMAQLPYLQPFDDVNNCVSRLAANIPLIRANLSPLSFTDLPRGLYEHAMLGVYELNRIELLRDVFLWSYERSADRYTAVRQSLGEPDPFRLRHRDELRTVVTEVVRGRLDRPTAATHISSWVSTHLDDADRDAFREVAENELLNLHEGNFARYPIAPAEFAAWQETWGKRGR